MKLYKLAALIILINSCSSNKEIDDPGPIDEFECSNTSAVAKGDRLFGIDMLDASETGSFDENLVLAKELGAEFTAVHITWSSMEPTANQISDFSDILASFNTYLTANNFKLNLTIRPIDLTGKTIPDDLKNARFNSDEMKARFKTLIDFIFSKIDYQLLTNFQIGNEIDGYDTSGEPASFLSDYGEFLFEMTTYIHVNYPDLKVGYTATHQGLMDDNDGIFKALAQSVDVLGVTYYPLTENFDAESPTAVGTDMDALIAKYNNVTQFNIQELGYQTSGDNASSETMQAQFFCNYFQSWDEHKDVIKLVNIVRLNDLSQSSAENLAIPYGLSANNFTEYLRTLGIRSYDGKGKNKEAFEVINKESSSRGWD